MQAQQHYLMIVTVTKRRKERDAVDKVQEATYRQISSAENHFVD